MRNGNWGAVYLIRLAARRVAILVSEHFELRGNIFAMAFNLWHTWKIERRNRDLFRNKPATGLANQWEHYKWPYT
ncbi:MAG: hypothetical protein ACI9BW_001595 [Gammaproteobacteria bacterium]|jgi:hypothetical protein